MSQTNRALRVNRVFAYRLRDARLSKGWNQKDLSRAMARVGDPVSVPTIAKIEAGRHGVGGDYGSEGAATFGRAARSVTLERAVAFAAALDIPPPSLFFPITRADDVRLAPELPPVDVEAAHAWARGERPLSPDDPDHAQYYRSQTFARRASLADLADLAPGMRVVIEPKEGPARADFLDPAHTQKED